MKIYRVKLKRPEKNWKRCEVIFEIENRQKRLEELEKSTSRQDLWDQPDRARDLLKEKTRVEATIERFKKLESAARDLEELYEIAREEADEKTLAELDSDADSILENVRDEEIRSLLGQAEDGKNAIMTIHAGAGGTEAQDWAEMLLRMYLRWGEKKGFKTRILDYQYGEEAGVKSATIHVEGEYAFGYSKAESGIHRLVRISPFDASSRRHTSFASVFVYPEVDDEIVVDIDEKDLKIDTYRSGGKGGQHVNKTDSAVRITHIPTNIVVQCQNERSQHKNKAMALKVLRSRLFELKRKEQEEKKDALHSSKKDIAWGSQIRSYVLHPYKLIKDHRTNLEVGNVQKVLDGEIDDFIEAYLLSESAAAQA
ncbi:MAG: bacterial peptide Chain Release Factor 2 [Deltaproteobacteria bacterium]|nr:bacterial peptide Chain Release Factor 2 [Deltaproteobacteria bacterium]